MKETMNRPLRLQNVVTKAEVFETLSSKANLVEALCTRQVCNGALMTPKKSIPQRRPKEEVLKGAKEFIDEYYTSLKKFNSEDHKTRWEFISASIEETGTYDLTEKELTYGTRLAWRNAPRCIARIQWSNLELFDCRHVSTPAEMFEAICNHIKFATNEGNIRLGITIFPARTDGAHDFRVWNSTLISYAGYRQEDGSCIGDPDHCEFTEICQSLGWQGSGSRWDILPIVLSANGQDPEWFELPPELIIIVPLSHPDYKFFEEMGLQWYGLPAVSNMCFDCGGVEFPACPFNGWYIVTEIAARNLCDPHRYNILEDVGRGMGLDTRNNSTLWKDRALVEVNVAVMHSFQTHKVAIMDHHSASESFMNHFANEQKLRGGCPADWVWIVPPMSGSLCPVFHQEMSLYHLKPSYEIQDPAWTTHVWKKSNDLRKTSNKSSREYRFKEIAWSVMFASQLYRKAVSKRSKVTILYASETGKSEMYAKRLEQIFKHTFNVQVFCMIDYDIINIEYETLLLVVTSTFGNGDPPGNGKEFAKNLHALKVASTATDISNVTKRLSVRNKTAANMLKENGVQKNFITSLKNNNISEDIFGPLRNIRFAVFALGSSAFPKFCAFGKYVDNMLAELGGEPFMDITCGDELAGQEDSFKQWSAEVFKRGCDTFCTDYAAVNLAKATLTVNIPTTPGSYKLKHAAESDELTIGLSNVHGKKIKTVQVLTSRNLHGNNESPCTQQVILCTGSDPELSYVPGDHVAIMPVNPSSLVDAVLTRLTNCPNQHLPVQVMVQTELTIATGRVCMWAPHDCLPAASVHEMLTYYLDIMTPPTPKFLHMLAEFAQDNEQKTHLDLLSTEPKEYEKWKTWNYPHLKEVLEQFPSVTVDVCMLLTHLPLLKERFYSISSSPATNPSQIHLTVGVVEYRTQGGKGPMHHGTCSNFLKYLNSGDTVRCFVKSADSFHMPSDPRLPIIMVGSGTGVSPFRGFWLQRYYDINNKKEVPGEMTQYFGCQTKALDLYAAEKEAMKQAGVLSNTYLALSREPNIPKTYVQDLLENFGEDIYRQIVKEKGHVYVCGDGTKGECVYQTLKSIVKEHGKLSAAEVENYILQMRDENRYHEDIFGIAFPKKQINQNQSQENIKVAQILTRGISSNWKRALEKVLSMERTEKSSQNCI